MFSDPLVLNVGFMLRRTGTGQDIAVIFRALAFGVEDGGPA